MGFSFRRSVSFGAFRLNVSSSGIGISTGVKGARISTGPRGAYVTLGAKGFYYRKRLGTTPPPGPDATSEVEDETDYRIHSASAEQIVDSDSQETLELINTCIHQASMYPLFIGLLIMALILSAPGWLLVIGGIVTYLVYRNDVEKRTFPLHYELDMASKQHYDELANGLSRASEAYRVWRILSSQPVSDRKRHAGASSTENRVKVTCSKLKPPFIATNIDVWGFKLDDQHILFFPERVLIFQAGTYGAVSYEQLQVFTDYATFIESQELPKDANVYGYTWQYVNKDGGPDRRFRGNRQIPIARYGLLSLASPSGMNIRLYFSNAAKVIEFQWAFYQYTQWLRTRGQQAGSQTKQPPPGGRQQRPPSHSPPKDPYIVLGIARSANLDEVTHAYRELAKNYHPDKVAHLAPEFRVLAETKMKEINQAYKELKGRLGQTV